MKILLVDDENGLLDQAKTYLQKVSGGFDIETADSAEEALDMLEDGDYDAIVSDYQMPDMDGLKLLEVIRRERESELPFIMFTGKGREEVAIEALNLGANRYIQKGGEPKSQYEILAKAVEEEVEHFNTKKRLNLATRSIDKSTLTIFWITPEGELEYVNDRACEKLGYSKDELLDMKVSDIDPNYPEEKREDQWERVKENKSLTFESEHRTKDGETFPVGITSHYLEFGEDEYEFAFAKDITERRKKEKEIKDMIRFRETVIENANVWIDVIDHKGDIVIWNKGAEEISGYQREEVVGHDKIWRWLYPDEEYREEILKEAKKVTNKGSSRENFETRIVTKEGDERVISWNSQKIEDESQYGTAVFVGKDVTERKESEKKLKESEERYRRLFETSKDGVLIIDAESGRIIDANPYIKNMFGYSLEELKGKRVWEVGSFGAIVDDRGEFDKLKEEEYIRCEDLTLSSEDDEEKAVEFVSNLYRVGDNKVLQWNIRNISSRKEVEKELKKRNEKIKKLHEKATELEKCEDEKEICEIVIEASEKILDFHVCGIDFVEEGEFVPIAFSSEIEGGFIRRKVEEAGISRKAYQENRSLLVEDSRELDFSKPVVSDYRASITIPMGDFGIYQALSTEVGAFDEKDLELAEILVKHATEVIQSLRSERELKERKKKIEQLHQASAELESCQSEEEIFECAITAAEVILDFDICGIDKVEGDKFVVKELSSGVPEKGSVERSIHEGGIDKKTYLNQESYLVDDLAEESDAKPVKGEYKSALSVPIDEYGVFQAVSSDVGHFDEEDLKMTQLLIDHVIEALKRLEMEEREEFLHSLLRHDVQNKTQVAHGYLQLLNDYDLSEEVQEYVGKAERSIKEGIKIIEKVRKLREIEKQEEIEKVNIDVILDQILSEYTDILHEKGISLELEKCESYVEGGILLKELFSNLVENSIRHSGCDRIRVKSCIEEDKCIVTIEDNGNNIPDEEKEKIFERGFKKGDNAGSGIGMYLVKEIAENYDGSVEVKDSELGGIRFDVHLEKAC